MHRTVIKNFQSQMQVRVLVIGKTGNEEFIGIVHDDDDSGIYFLKKFKIVDENNSQQRYVPENGEILITWRSLLRIEKI